jgi:hypothetical protein
MKGELKKEQEKEYVLERARFGTGNNGTGGA